MKESRYRSSEGRWEPPESRWGSTEKGTRPTRVAGGAVHAPALVLTAPCLPSCRWMELLEEAVQNATRRPGAAPTPAHPPPPGPQGPANQSPRPHRCFSSRPLPSPASHSLAAALCPHLWAHLRLPPVCCAQEPLPAVMATTLNVGWGQNRDGRGLVGTHLCAGCQQVLKPGPSWTLHLHCPFSVGRVGFHNLSAYWLAESQRSQQVTCHRLSPPGQNWMTQKCSTVNQSLRGCLEVRVWSPPDWLLLLPQHSPLPDSFYSVSGPRTESKLLCQGLCLTH